DATWALGARHELGFGFNLRRRRSEIDGYEAADSTDYASGAPARHIVSRPGVDYPGFYIEDKMRLWGPLYATAGARADYASSSEQWTVDPRAAVAWRVDDRQTVRLATGRYHQLPRARYRDPVYGNPGLGPMRADHVIMGYERISDHSNVRLEAYRKSYRELVTNDAASFYANGGHGYATGADAYVKGNVKWLSGWVSYGYLDTRRKEFSNRRQVPSAYGVRHSLTLVGTYQYNPAWSVGSRYSASSGRPFTPVLSATYDTGRDLWRPGFAEDNSGQLPAYHRLDVRLTKLFSMPKGLSLPASSVCVAYCEGLNVLGLRNVLDYSYNEDYTERREQESYFARRMLVAGFALSW
ncbi:MAG: TonB-dependent receptor, partial [Candidatus Eisenbacteria bacterium]